jgi:hypothetical protein
MNPRPVLILGVPRSGTSWIEQVLGAAPGLRIADEPDNETATPWPLLAKSGLGRFPLLDREDRCPPFERLWREAFSASGSPRRAELARSLQRRLSPFDLAEAACDPERRLGARGRALALLSRPIPARPRRPGRSNGESLGQAVAKSVHAPLCAAWLAHRFRPAILVVRRDPVEVAASWRAMAARSDGRSNRLEYAGRPERLLSPAALRRLSEAYGPPGRSPRDGVIWLAGALMSELRSFATRSPEVTVLDFDAACVDPVAVLSGAARSVGLPWTEESEATLRAMDQPGAGWEVSRHAARVPGQWRARLPAAEIAEIERGLDRFEPLRHSART